MRNFVLSVRRLFLRDVLVSAFIISLSALLVPLSANAVLVAPSIDLTQVALTASLQVCTSSGNPCSPVSNFYDYQGTITPSIDDLNIFRSTASTPSYQLESSYVSPAHGASSYAHAFGSFSSIATLSNNGFYLEVSHDFSASARSNAVSYDCGTPGNPQTCLETAVAKAGAANDYQIYFTLLQPFAYDFWGVDNFANLSIARAGGRQLYSGIEMLPKATLSAESCQLVII